MEEKDDRAGLIGQAIPEVVETEPRLITTASKCSHVFVPYPECYDCGQPFSHPNHPEEVDVASHEQCICAAIQFPTNRTGMIVRGHRHDACYKTAMGIPAVRDYLHEAEQGFITSTNRFVGRKEAMRLQVASGIQSAADGGYRGDILFSEDLY